MQLPPPLSRPTNRSLWCRFLSGGRAAPLRPRLEQPGGGERPLAVRCRAAPRVHRDLRARMPVVGAALAGAGGERRPLRLEASRWLITSLPPSLSTLPPGVLDHARREGEAVALQLLLPVPHVRQRDAAPVDVQPRRPVGEREVPRGAEPPPAPQQPEAAPGLRGAEGPLPRLLDLGLRVVHVLAEHLLGEVLPAHVAGDGGERLREVGVEAHRVDLRVAVHAVGGEDVAAVREAHGDARDGELRVRLRVRVARAGLRGGVPILDVAVRVISNEVRVRIAWVRGLAVVVEDDLQEGPVDALAVGEDDEHLLPGAEAGDRRRPRTAFAGSAGAVAFCGDAPVAALRLRAAGAACPAGLVQSIPRGAAGCAAVEGRRTSYAGSIRRLPPKQPASAGAGREQRHAMLKVHSRL
eukprot:gene1742-biopygen7339